MDIGSEILTTILFLALFVVSVPFHEMGHAITMKMVSYWDKDARIEISEINLLNLFGSGNRDDCAGYVTYFVLGRLTFTESMLISFSGGAFASLLFGLSSLLFTASSSIFQALLMVSVGQFVVGIWEASDQLKRGANR
jgi:hypothetical protein